MKDKEEVQRNDAFKVALLRNLLERSLESVVYGGVRGRGCICRKREIYFFFLFDTRILTDEEMS